MDTGSLIAALLDRIKPAETAAALIVNLILTLLIAVVGLALARAARRRLVRAVGRTRASGNLAVLLGNTAFIGVVALAVLLTLQLYGLDATALVAVLGVGTVAIGLALQDVLKNLFAGAYLLLEQPFRIGDTIVVDNREGEVESIEVRTTVLRMRDGTQALVPNALVFATTVMNRTAYPTRRVSIRISGLTAEMDEINRRVMTALAGAPSLAPTPVPQVHIGAIEAGTTTVIVDVWRRADCELAPEVLLALQAAFPGAGVTLQP
jgi:small conductance mechanosensitive channel